MPATFPAHPAAVLALKLWRPAWFDGVALVVGSMAPDLPYALDGSRLEHPFPGLPPLWELAHSLPWFLAWAVPVTVALCPLIRLSAPIFASHLPAQPPRGSASTGPAASDSRVSGLAAASDSRIPGATAALRRLASGVRAGTLADVLAVAVAGVLAGLRGYAFLGRGPRWYITVSSAGIGALSHVLWDRIALGPLDLASSLLGGLFGLWLLLHLGRRLPPPAQHRGGTGAVFWGTAAAVLATGGVFLPFLPGYFLPHTTSARVILLAIAAVLIAAAATRSRPFRREPLQQ